jgi:hypothetical protein
MMGVICFELPLRGMAACSVVKYSLHRAAVDHGKFPPLAKDGPYLFPKRRPTTPRILAFSVLFPGASAPAVGLRRRGLRDADGIRSRKRVDQACFQPRMHFLVSDRGFAGVGSVLVMGRGIEFLSHVESP